MPTWTKYLKGLSTPKEDQVIDYVEKNNAALTSSERNLFKDIIRGKAIDVAPGKFYKSRQTEEDAPTNNC